MLLLNSRPPHRRNSVSILSTEFKTIPKENRELIQQLLPGQISATLTSFSRSIDDYNRLAKQEPVQEKQEKAFTRVKAFRSELSDYREQLDRLKQELDERVRRP
jgi:septation ring formation regulator EzrA